MLRVIGDVHGVFAKYHLLIRKADYSVQVGDMCGGVGGYSSLAHVDASRHRFIPGNHEHYPTLPPQSLGDFGMCTDMDVPFFFVRGAHSIDGPGAQGLSSSMPGVHWFQEEQLTYTQGMECMAQYEAAKPDIVISHDCPQLVRSVIWHIHARSATTNLLQAMFEVHCPKFWLFGHHHKPVRRTFNGTQFICLGCLESVDIFKEEPSFQNSFHEYRIRHNSPAYDISGQKLYHEPTRSS